MKRDSNGIWTQNHLVRKRTLNHLAKLAFSYWAVLWVLIGTVQLTLCYYHVTYKFQSITTQASLAKWLTDRLRTKRLWVWIPLLLFKLQIWRLLRARSSLTFRQSIECGHTVKLVRNMIITYSQDGTSSNFA